MKIDLFKLLGWGIFLTGLITYTIISDKDKTLREQELKQRTEKHFDQSLKDPNKTTRGWDFDEEIWIQYTPGEEHINRFPTDQELRELKERLEYDTGGRYLYTPGRNIRTTEQQIQQTIEEYIEDNIDEIMDQYGY